MKNKSDTLHLVLKGKWYDMIESGIKTEEYREIKPYWINRLIDKDYPQPIAIDFELNVILYWSYFNFVCFHRGYTDTTMTFQLNNVISGKGKHEWGAPKNKRSIYPKIRKESEMRKTAKNSTFEEFRNNCVFADKYDPRPCRYCFDLHDGCMAKQELGKIHNNENKDQSCKELDMG